MRSKYPVTIIFGLIGLVAIAIWVVTFEPHGGINLSNILFPISSALLNLIFPNKDVPVALWYLGAFLQYIGIGLIIDIFRGARRNKEMKSRHNQ